MFKRAPITAVLAAATSIALVVAMFSGVGAASSAAPRGMAGAVGSARWSLEAVPAPSGAANPGLSGVSCPRSNLCTAVGAYNTGPKTLAAATLAERWNGRRWSVQTTPNPSSDSFFNGVSCPSPKACAAVGYYYAPSSGRGPNSQPLTEIWKARKWTVEAAPNPAGTGTQLLGVSCTAANACTAVGYYQRRHARLTLAERWNGRRWSVQRTPNPAKNNNLFNAVSCTSTNECVAVGSYFNTSLSAQVPFAERWNGRRWKIQTTPPPKGSGFSLLLSVSCVFTDRCTAVGVSQNQQGDGLTLAEGWNGRRWKIQITANPSGATYSALSSISCTSARTCTSTGEYEPHPHSGDLTLAERWNGRRWKIQPTPNPPRAKSSFLNSVSCASASACTAIGGASTGMFAERYS